MEYILIVLAIVVVLYYYFQAPRTKFVSLPEPPVVAVTPSDVGAPYIVGGANTFVGREIYIRHVPSGYYLRAEGAVVTLSQKPVATWVAGTRSDGTYTFSQGTRKMFSQNAGVSLCAGCFGTAYQIAPLIDPTDSSGLGTKFYFRYTYLNMIMGLGLTDGAVTAKLGNGDSWQLVASS